MCGSIVHPSGRSCVPVSKLRATLGVYATEEANSFAFASCLRALAPSLEIVALAEAIRPHVVSVAVVQLTTSKASVVTLLLVSALQTN